MMHMSPSVLVSQPVDEPRVSAVASNRLVDGCVSLPPFHGREGMCWYQRACGIWAVTAGEMVKGEAMVTENGGR